MAKPYSKKEDGIIMDKLPLIGYDGVLEMLPGRTRDGISSRAKVLRERGLMTGVAVSFSPVGKPTGKNKPRGWNKALRLSRGGTRHDRYMAGESVGCV